MGKQVKMIYDYLSKHTYFKPVENEYLYSKISRCNTLYFYIINLKNKKYIKIYKNDSVLEYKKILVSGLENSNILNILIKEIRKEKIKFLNDL